MRPEEGIDPAAGPAPAGAEEAGEEGGGFPDRRFIDLSRDPTPGVPDHAAPEDD